LPFPIIFSFILNLLKQSIPKELNIFSKHLQIERPTRSAVTQARAKLSPQAFVELNRTLIQEFYTDNDFKTFQNFILLAIDGSTGQLPNSPELIGKYGYASNQTESEMAMTRISCLYDTLNNLTWDARIKPYGVGERDIAIEHFEAIKTLKIDLKRILVIFDRGYPSFALMYYLQQNGFNFLIRCGSGFLKEINATVSKNKKDTILRIPLKRASRAAKKELLFLNLDSNNSILFRVVVVELSTGEKEILLTSLICKKTYPRKIFRSLYFHRWKLEEGYKHYKSNVEIENFSGKSSLIIEQDFHAAVLVTNAHALLNLEATREIKDSCKESMRQYEYSVNKKVSIRELKNYFVEVLLHPEKDIEEFCEEVKRIMKKDLIPIRPWRSFKRIRKYPHRKYHMNQR
jgi:hypothetical protein